MRGLPQLAAAAAGALALAVGGVLLLDREPAGVALLVGGAALLWWSVLKPR